MNPTVVARGSLNQTDVDALYVGPLPRISNNGGNVFEGRFSSADGSLSHHDYFLMQSVTGGFARTLVVPSGPSNIPHDINQDRFLWPVIADDGTVVVRAGLSVTSPLRIYQSGLISPTDLATTAAPGDFSSIGKQPGISDDGRVIAFAARKKDGATGIFISARYTATGFSDLAQIVGPGAPGALLGYDANANPLYFAGIALDGTVGVAHLSGGEPGLAGDSVVISFYGTPNAASRDNPAAAGAPLLFSDQKGLWTVQVDFDREIKGHEDTSDPGGDGDGECDPREMCIRDLIWPPHTNGVRPVVQVGDEIGSGTVMTLYASIDPIAIAETENSGNPRTSQRGDHRLAFLVGTDQGTMLLRGSR